jgi:hypothetical protein
VAANIRHEAIYGPGFQRLYCDCGWVGSWFPDRDLFTPRTEGDTEPGRARLANTELKTHLLSCPLNEKED